MFLDRDKDSDGEMINLLSSRGGCVRVFLYNESRQRFSEVKGAFKPPSSSAHAFATSQDDAGPVADLLRFVTSSTIRCRALIDTGALVFGMSNQQVAQHLCESVRGQLDGCVFLDSHNNPRVLKHDGQMPLLTESDIPLHRRLVFYDQVRVRGRRASVCRCGAQSDG